MNFTDPNGLAAMQDAGGIIGGIGGVLFQGGVDLISGKLSSLQTYAGAAAGGVAGGVAATLRGPACAGAAAGAANNLAMQAMAGNGFSGTSLLIEASDYAHGKRSPDTCGLELPGTDLLTLGLDSESFNHLASSNICIHGCFDDMRFRT